MTTVPVPLTPSPPITLTASQFQDLAEVPPEIEWFANLTNANTRRAYRAGHRGLHGLRRPAAIPSSSAR